MVINNKGGKIKLTAKSIPCDKFILLGNAEYLANMIVAR